MKSTALILFLLATCAVAPACSLGHPLTGIYPQSLPEDDSALNLLGLLGLAAGTNPGDTAAFDCAASTLNFQASTVPASPWPGGAHGNGLFVSIIGSGVDAITSPDGINWTVRTVPAGLYESVDFANDRFLAGTTGGAMISSTDGISWTSNTTASAEVWRDVVYHEGRFVIMGINASMYADCAP